MPVTTADEVTDPATHFRHVTLRITADQAQGVVTTARINAALAAVGLATIRDLTTRLDLVIPFERALYSA